MKLVRLPGICKNRVYLQQAALWKFVLCEFKVGHKFHLETFVEKLTLWLKLQKRWQKFDCNNDKQLQGNVLLEQTRNILQTNKKWVQTTKRTSCC